MQEAILSVSLKDFKARIDDLKASLLGLEKNSDEYKKTLEQVREMQQKLNDVMYDTKRGTDAAKGSYDSLVQEMSALKKEWRATNDEAKRNELGKQIDDINSKLKDFDQSIGVHSRNVGDYAIAGQSMKSTVKEMQEQLAQMIANGVSPSDEAFVQLAQRAGKLRDALGDAKSIVGQFADDAKGLSTVIDVAKTGTAVFGAWQGAMSAFGMESESTAKAIQKLQGVMTLLNSLQTIQTALVDKQSKTYQLLASVYNKLIGVKTASVAATKADIVATNADTVAKNAEATATNAATTATNGLRVALVKSGIGAFVVLLGALVAYLVTMSEKLKSATNEALSFADGINKTKDSLEELGKVQDDITNKKLSFGDITEVEASTEKLEHSKQVLEGLLDSILAAMNRSKDLHGSLGFNAIANDVDELSFALRNNTKTAEGQKNTYESFAKTTTVVKAKLNDIEKALEDDEYRTKLFGKTSKAELISIQTYLQSLLNGYNQLGVVLDNNASLKKTEDSEKQKKAEEAKRKADEAARKRQEALTKAQNEHAKAVSRDVEKLKQDNNETVNAIKYTQRLEKAQGKLVDETKNKVEIINDEIVALKKEVELYDRLSKDSKLSVDVRDGYAKKASEARLNILNKERERTIVITEKSTEGWLKKWKEKIAAHSKVWEDHLRDLSFYSSQIEIGIKPIVAYDKDEIEKATEVLEEYTRNFYANSVDRENPNGFSIPKLSETYEKALELERTYGNELLGIRKLTSEDLIKVEMIMAEATSNTIVNKFKGIIDGLKKQREEAIAQGKDVTDIDKQVADAEMAIEEEKTKFFIEQSERRKRASEEEKKNHKEWVKAQIDGFLNYADSVGGLMGSISDIMQQNIDQKVKNGEISEEEAQKEFERVKKLQIAELWLTTLSGAAGAFLQDMKSFPSPWNVIIAASDFATAMAMGAAQTKQIKSMQYGGEGGGSSNTVAQAKVSPLLNEALDSQTMTSLNIEGNTSKQPDTKVYILESDIQKAETRVKTREKNTTF